MSASALSTNPATVTISRSVVIGLGELGLQAISLLLTRLEVYYQFVAETQDPVTSLGLLYRQNGMAEYHTVKRAEGAFTNALEICDAILRPPPMGSPIRPKLLELLQLALPEQVVSLRAWLDELLQPAIVDAHSYVDSIAHLNLYVIASATEPVLADLEAIVREIAGRRLPPVTMNLIGHLGAPLNLNDLATAASASFLGQLPALSGGGTRLQRIYLLDHAKQNLATTESLGEAAMGICNFLEQLVLSRLGDELAETGLSDAAALAARTPYSSFGAAKLYVPIAEMSSAILTRVVAERLQRAVEEIPKGQKPDLIGILGSALDLLTLSRTILGGQPVEPVSRSSWLQMQAQELMWRLRGTSSDPQVARMRLLREVPRLRVSRRYWRMHLRAYGRRRTPDIWWQALCAFEQELFERALPTTISHATHRLGVSVDDERLVQSLSTAPMRRDPVVVELGQGTAQERSSHLGIWVRDRRPDLQALLSSLQSEAEERIFNGPALDQRELISILSTWLGSWLWVGRPKQGMLEEVSSGLRREAAAALAVSLGWATSLAQSLADMHTCARAVHARLGAWAEVDGIYAAQVTPELQALQLEEEKQRLIAALRSRPYPAALMGRLAVFWLLPLSVLASAINAGLIMPPPWEVSFQQVVIGFTVAIILLYSLLLGLNRLRSARAQASIERIVFDHAARVFERRIYASSDAPPPPPLTAARLAATPPSTPVPIPTPDEPIPGVIQAYLQALERLLFAPPLFDSHLPGSLFATLKQAREILGKGYNTDNEQPRPESVLCRSIGDRLTHELIELGLRKRLEDRPFSPKVDAVKLSERMESSTMLSAYLRQVLKNELGREYVATVRGADVLRLQGLLMLPEYRQVNLGRVVDDLRLRAKPMVSTAQGTAQQALSRETLHYLGADPALIAEYLRPQLRPEKGLYISLVRGPYGLSFTTIVQGLPYEALPVQASTERRP